MIFLLAVSVYSEESEWQQYWLNGLECFHNCQYSEAEKMFSAAIKEVPEECIEENLHLLMSLAETHYMLKEFDDAIQNIEELMGHEQFLSDQEKLLGGNILVGSLWGKGSNDEAVEAYLKYIAGSRLAPRCEFVKNKIIVRNIPTCGIYKKKTKKFLMEQFCNDEKNFLDYGDIWVISKTRTCACAHDIPIPFSMRRITETREISSFIYILIH